jgi:hypothetical protein
LPRYFGEGEEFVNGAEILTTVAQLAVAVTGFSGIAIAFNRHPGRLSDWEAFRVLILFANSFAAIFLSLGPFAFFYLGWSESAIWRTSSGLCALFEIIFLCTLTGPTRKMLRDHRQLFNMALFGFMVSGHALNTVLQLSNTFGLAGSRYLAVFIFGVLWLLFQSVFQFGRILFVQPETGGSMSRGSPGDPQSESDGSSHSP